MRLTRRQSSLFTCALVGLLAVSLLGMGLIYRARAKALAQAESTLYLPLSGEAEWVGNWEFSELGADPSEAGAERVTIPFSGAEFALVVRRGDYRGAFYVTVDGAPANRLPQEAGRGYLVLTSPDGQPEEVVIPVASGLADGAHVAEVVADRGWDQWPLMGWRVGRGPATAGYDAALVGLGLLAAASLGLLAARSVRSARQHLEPAAASAMPSGVDAALLSGRWLQSATGQALIALAMLAAAVAFYFLRGPVLTGIVGLALLALIMLRIDLGLALVAAAAPFHLQLRPLLGKQFSMVELALLACACAWGLRWAIRIVRAGVPRSALSGPKRLALERLTALDVAVLSFVLVAVLSLFVAEHRRVALRELRVLIFEPALCYLMLRTVRLDDRAVRTIVDGLALGAVAVALIGLVTYALGTHVITAEEGFRRLRSVYDSPNSVGLYLGRALPLLVAVALFGGGRDRWRRLVYGLAALPVGLAILLSFSKGALLLGVPLSLLALGVLAGGRWRWAGLAVVGAVALAGLALLRTPRFASLLDPSSGTTFFRVQLWRSSWRMALDHPWLGVGPDNFLYAYRSRYILPAAWQEPHISQAHNILLDYATRMGLAGLAAGLGLQIAFWRMALPLRCLSDPAQCALALGLMGAMVNFLAHGLVDASYFLVDLAYVFFLTLALIHWLTRNGVRDEVEA